MGFNSLYYNKFFIKNENEKICHYRNCNNEVSFIGLKMGYRKYCSASCCNKEKIFSDQFIENNRQAQIIAQNKPEVKQKSRETATAQWKNPIIRYKTIKSFKEFASRPEIKKRMSELAINRFKNPEFKKRYSESIKKLWLNEEYRKQVLSSGLTNINISFMNIDINKQKNAVNSKYVLKVSDIKEIYNTAKKYNVNVKFEV